MITVILIHFLRQIRPSLALMPQKKGTWLMNEKLRSEGFGRMTLKRFGKFQSQLASEYFFDHYTVGNICKELT